MEWISNEAPPWAAYRTTMGCRLVALDKQPGVRPLGIGEIWRRVMAKFALKACQEDIKAACGSMNLCTGLEADIEGVLHPVSARAAAKNTMEFGDWEVDDSIFSLTAGEGEMQDSLPMRRAQTARAAAAAAVVEPVEEAETETAEELGMLGLIT